MLWIWMWTPLAILLPRRECAPLAQNKLPPKEMETFMKRFGYIESRPNSADALYTEDGFRESVQQMQKYGGLPETGELDEATLNLTRAPRCGVPDVIRNRRRKRYIIGSEAWRKKKLTYFLANWPPEMDPELTRSKLSSAFDLWSGVTPLKFVPRESMDADMIVAFGRGAHGDGYPFDGQGSILAHAFFPYEHDSYGGDVHFDDDENWIDGSTTKDEEGVDFYTVAAHEIGHSLGLAHSTVGGSIMFPYYKGYDPHMRLDYDDVVAMYSIYVLDANFEDDGPDAVTEPPVDDDPRTRADDYVTYPTEVTSDKNDERDTWYDDYVYGDDYNTSTERDPELTTAMEPELSSEGTDASWSSSTETPFTPTPEAKGVRPVGGGAVTPNICDGYIDAASIIRGELFVFRGLYFWRLRDRYLEAQGYPVDFHLLFRGLPRAITSIDAVYQRPRDHYIIFFTGREYWIFDGNHFTSDSPLPLTTLGLPADLDKVDAAIVWAKNGKTYFFSGKFYWRYDDVAKQMDRGYPQRINRWKGLPPNLDAAFTWKDGITYFFKDKNFWRFNNQNVSVDANYPLPTAPYWFGCSA